MDDGTLLRQFAQDGSPGAFRELVGRYANLVFACARQRLRDAHAESTTRSATALAGTATATLMLVKGAFHAMFIAKLKTVAVITAACAVVTGTSVVVAQKVAENPQPPTKPQAAETQLSKGRIAAIEPSTAPREKPPAPSANADAEALLARWLRALAAGDLAAYQQCLHPDAVKVNEYGTAEALAFWTKQIKDLRKDGFKGEWEFRKPAEVNERFPAGSAQAHPIVNGKPSRESILLIQESGRWVIARLFS